MHCTVIGEWEKGRQRKKERERVPQAMHRLRLASAAVEDIWIGAN